MYKRSLLALALAGVCSHALSADYYVVVPMVGKTLNASAIHVSLSQSSLPGGLVGSAYSYDFKQNLQVNGDPAYTGYGVKWAVVSGNLPAGLTLNTSTGVMSGTPTTAGESSFTLAVSYKSKTASSVYQHSAITPVASCALPWGGTLASGVSIVAYAASTVAYGGTCAAEQRTCTNGSLSGTNTARTCTAELPGIVSANGTRTWADGSVARSCQEYRNPPAGYQYAGATGDGTYRIDPDGAGGVSAFDVYCDMTTSGGGWTKVPYSADLTYKQQFSGADAWRWLPTDFSLSFSKAQIDALRAVSTTAKQRFVGLCNGFVVYYYAGGPWYDEAVGFKFHTGTLSSYGTQVYTPSTITVVQDGCKSNGGEGGTVANSTIFDINNINLPVTNVYSHDNGGAGESFGSPLTQYPAWFR